VRRAELVWGAHASRVWVRASRPNLRETIYGFGRFIGGTPINARQRRALPRQPLISECGVRRAELPAKVGRVTPCAPVFADATIAIHVRRAEDCPPYRKSCGIEIIQPRVGPSRTGEELPWVVVQPNHSTLTGLYRFSAISRRRCLRTAHQRTNTGLNDLIPSGYT
jgi:hypothetical protein